MDNLCRYDIHVTIPANLFHNWKKTYKFLTEIKKILFFNSIYVV